MKERDILLREKEIKKSTACKLNNVVSIVERAKKKTERENSETKGEKKIDARTNVEKRTECGSRGERERERAPPPLSL